jgi:GTPase SAR1 family protein
VYDVGRRDSFEHVQSWYDRAKQLGGEDICPILVGNKCDLDESSRQVSAAEGEELGKVLGVPYVETSALNGLNVESAFVTMTKRIKVR